MSRGAEVLVILGGALQVAGVVIVVFQIRGTLRRAKEFRRRPVTARARMVAASAAMGRPTVTTGREPTVEERVARVEEAIASAREELDSAKIQLRKDWRQDLAEAISDLAADLQTEDEALRALVLSVFEGRGRLGRWLQFAGPVLIVAGIALATWGAILG
jgi:hypothetical protein